MVETLRAAWRELGAEAHPHPERALMIPLHAPGAMLGVFGAIDLERPHVLNDAEERILSFAISNFLAALHERSFLRRTTQLASFGELVTEIAHDLRHPMTSMRGAARVLRNQWSDEAKRERCLMALGSDLSRMESLVTELVTFYRGDDISMVSVDLHQLLDKALEAVAQTIEREAIEVERRYEADPAAVMGLARNLIEAFVNLFVNAIQAMGRGGLLTVRTSPNLEDADLSRLVAAGLDPSEYVRVDVADTGPGIAPENVDKIFMRFFTTKPDGCGLGLSAVHRILKKNLGLIRVESEPGRGATFTVLLPKA
jgi:signal transduction histidine kinase